MLDDHEDGVPTWKYSDFTVDRGRPSEIGQLAQHVVNLGCSDLATFRRAFVFLTGEVADNMCATSSNDERGISP
jgi:hypothetical protein